MKQDDMNYEQLSEELTRLNNRLSALNESNSSLAEKLLKLKDYDKSLKSILDNLPAVVYLLNNDKKYSVIYLNDSVEKLTGYTKEEFYSEEISFMKLYHPEDVPGMFKRMNEAISNHEPYHLIFRMKNKDGEWHWIEEYGNPIVNDKSELINFAGFFYEISERKKYESELSDSEARHRILFETASDAIFLMAEDRFIDCNQKTLEMFGCKRPQIIGQPPYRFSPSYQPDGRKSIDKALEKIQAALAGENQNFEWLHCRYDQTPFEAEVSLRKVILSDKPHIVATVRDISKRVQSARVQKVLANLSQAAATSDDLRDLLVTIREQLGILLDTTNFYVALYNTDTGLYSFPYYEDEYDNLESYEPVHLENSLTDYVRKTGQAILVDSTKFSQLVSRGEVKLVGTDNPLWLGAPLKTERGTIGVVVVQSYNNASLYAEHDLELLNLVAGHIASALEKARVTEQIRESEERFRTLAENTLEIIGELDKKGRVLYTSPNITEFTGYEQEELVGHNFLKLLHPKDRRRIIVEYSRGVESKEAFHMEFRIQRKNGDWLYAECSGKPYRTSSGEMRSVIVGRNITERKHAEETFRESENLKTAQRLAGAVAHEFRQPLAALMLISDLAKSSLKNEHSLQQNADKIAKSVAQVNDLVTKLQDITDISLKPYAGGGKIFDLNKSGSEDEEEKED